ncbi:MAG TPA: methionine aminotransferase [Saprospiraceae bacterium]|nr:methionine aminotransferase [Saprospiraceae bacterium]HMQ81918.1 methionine aminotransferase [Saprospiraceae bacterium]
MNISSKLPDVETSIFTVMSALAHEHNAINLSQGFPDFQGSPELSERVCHYMRKGYNQYAPMAGVPALRQQIAQKVALLYGIDVNPDTEITITSGATQGIFSTIAAFIKPGDEVILFEPAYDSYRPSVLVNGGIPVVLELEAPHYRIDWERVEQLISPKTRMIIINTPHNPTGTILAADDLLALAALTKGTDILVLSDEVYEHLVYDGLQHQSVLRFSDLKERSLAVYSFGKTFHNTGWKIGYCIAPAALTQEFRKVHQFTVFSVNTPIQYALADYLADASHYLELNAFFQKKRDLFLGIIKDSLLKPLPCQGTYFQLFDYSAISQEGDVGFARRMTMTYGVAAIPVSVFYTQRRDDKVIRLCFAKEETTLSKAGLLLNRIGGHS